MRRASGHRPPWQIASALAVVLVIIVIAVAGSGGGGTHTITTVVPSAGYLSPGYQIRAAGRPVGSVDSVQLTRDYKARLVMTLDNSVWPLPVDSTMAVRMGGTIRIDDRYIALQRGRSSRVIPAGGTFPASRFSVPVEFEDIFTMLKATPRRELKSLIDSSGPAAAAAAQPLRSTLGAAPPALRQLGAVFTDLGGDPRSLDLLVRESNRAVGAIATANHGIGELMSGAGSTFAGIGDQAVALQSALTETPGTLSALRATLGHADRTLIAANALSRRLGPGVEALRTLTRPLQSTLASLVAVGPDARDTLATARAAAPQLDSLLARTQALMPALAGASGQAATQLDCIRPYAPEIAGFASDWGAGAWSRGDGQDKYVRAVLGASQVPYTTPLNSKQLHGLLPGVKKVEFRPPGELVDQPWFQPQCGIGQQVLSPSYDPESQLVAGVSRGSAG